MPVKLFQAVKAITEPQAEVWSNIKATQFPGLLALDGMKRDHPTGNDTP